jgi:peptidyl-prolyl cis-trans isomerase A (cyclophilin A)
MKSFIKCQVILFSFLLAINTGCNKNPVITISTELGEINVELFNVEAPVTVANFLQYVDSSLFIDGSFYRVVTMGNQPRDSVKIAVIQGGRQGSGSRGFAPIEHENTGKTGILHKNGTISMARSRIGSATSEFFICVGDQPDLDLGGKRNADGQGFAAFGKVVDGMDVVLAIHKLGTENQYLATPVKIIGIERK